MLAVYISYLPESDESVKLSPTSIIFEQPAQRQHQKAII